MGFNSGFKGLISFRIWIGFFWLRRFQSSVLFSAAVKLRAVWKVRNALNGLADFRFTRIVYFWIFLETHVILFADETLLNAGYDRWYPGEPDGGTDQNCGVINRNSLLGNSPCYYNFPFFCELEY